MSKEKIYNKTKITVVKDYKEMSQLAARLILQKIYSKSIIKLNINLLVPTGSTPEGVYKIISKQPKKLFKHVRFFNMDEYCQKDGKRLVNKNNPVSYKKYMKEHLFRNISSVQSHFPGVENIKKPGSYDKQIQKYGGIDFCVNALGIDGHTFGFNFPGSSFGSVTRLVKINEITRKINKKKSGYKTPEYAVTTGLKTGMKSKEVLFLVSGREKADILHKIVYSSKPTTKIPATILKLHPRCRWIVDEDAASKL